MSSLITNIVRNKNNIFTNDYAFAIKPLQDYDFQTHSDSLYIKNDFKIDENSALANLIKHNFIVKTKTMQTPIKKVKYDKYKFYRPLKDERKYNKKGPIDDDVSLNENDCLKFAECLTFANQKNDMIFFNNLLKAINNPPILQSTSKKYFSDTEYYEDNIEILNHINDKHKNNYAVPKNGQSYAIVRKEIKDNAAYHIAFVLYTHNGINITLEAEADSKNDYQPKFSFYDINPEGKTFHRRWSAELYRDSNNRHYIDRYNALYNNGETIVLESRNIEDVIKEVEKEKRKLDNTTKSSKMSRKKTRSLTPTIEITGSTPTIQRTESTPTPYTRKRTVSTPTPNTRKRTRRV